MLVGEEVQESSGPGDRNRSGRSPGRQDMVGSRYALFRVGHHIQWAVEQGTVVEGVGSAVLEVRGLNLEVFRLKMVARADRNTVVVGEYDGGVVPPCRAP